MCLCHALRIVLIPVQQQHAQVARGFNLRAERLQLLGNGNHLKGRVDLTQGVGVPFRKHAHHQHLKGAPLMETLQQGVRLKRGVASLQHIAAEHCAFELHLKRAQVLHAEFEVVQTEVEGVVAHRVQHVNQRFRLQFVLTPARFGEVAVFQLDELILFRQLFEIGRASGDAAHHRLATAAGRNIAVRLGGEGSRQRQRAGGSFGTVEPHHQQHRQRQTPPEKPLHREIIAYFAYSAEGIIRLCNGADSFWFKARQRAVPSPLRISMPKPA
ncbi:hypothetical protein HRbin14_00737 [bacterium HR14]|nr:hypothetical protein HRbin14_00737 [bacterium HR14]